MTIDHHAEAERLLASTAGRSWSDPSPYLDRLLAAAQVHATLATSSNAPGPDAA